MKLLVQRVRLIGEVIELKRVRGLSVVDAERETEMFRRVEAPADDEGLDPRIARDVLRAVIESFTLLEIEQLEAPR